MKELILQLFCPCLSFKVLFCCVIAEFAPNVTDMSHPGYFTHDALVVVVFFFLQALVQLFERAMCLLYHLFVF